jgi:hypothetical protein
MRANLPSLPDVTGNGWSEWETNQNRLVYLVGLRDLEKQFFRGLLVIGPIEQHYTIRPDPGSSRVVLKRKSRISSWSAVMLAPFFLFPFFC